ncbi:MAG: hypothetical protein N2749_00910 [Clostridia bacterium]|nr:hypothetical protein [Clostridia bacterium]
MDLTVASNNAHLTHYDYKNDYQQRIEELILQLISPANKHNFEHHKNFVLEHYKKEIATFKYKDALMNHILDEVFYYNLEIITEIATEDFYVYFHEQLLELYAEDDPENIDFYIDENIMELANSYYSDLYYDYFLDVPDYISSILDVNKLYYELFSEHEIYYDFSSIEYSVVKNDCQIFMFPEIHIHQITSCTDFFSDKDHQGEAIKTRVLFKR